MMVNQVTNSIFENFKNRANRIGIRIKNNKTQKWEEYKWEEIESKIRQIAYVLIKKGVNHQDKIAIFSQNNIDWVLTDIAIMSIGAVTVPIYATNTSKQAKYIVEDAQIKLIFAGDEEQYEKSLEIIKENDTTLEKIVVFNPDININNSSSEIFNSYLNEEIDENIISEFDARRKQVQPSDLSSLIYTSGTTGEPKGVMLSHNNIISSFRIHDKFLSEVNDSDHSLSFLPLSHIFERSWTLYCMHKGIKVSMLSDPKLIIETLKEVQPTVICTVPRIYEKVYGAIKNGLSGASKLKNKIFSWSIKQGKLYYDLKNKEQKIANTLNIKKIIADKLVLNKIKGIMGGKLKMTPTGGAPLSAEIQAFMRNVGIPMTMGYGLTETVASVTAFPLNHYKIGSSGKLLPELELKIGKDDEILVKGPTVMQGYYNKPDATAEVFEDGWFKTGDAGSIDADGNLTITDRIKDLLKTSGGKYIAPQPIESLLMDDNFIEQAMVIGDQYPFVTAFVVPNFEALKEYASSLELKFKDVEDLISIPKIKEFYDEKVEALQKELANFEKIKKFKLLPKEFSMEKGELTPTLKMKRKMIVNKFQHFISDLYDTKK